MYVHLNGNLLYICEHGLRRVAYQPGNTIAPNRLGGATKIRRRNFGLRAANNRVECVYRWINCSLSLSPVNVLMESPIAAA